MATRPKTPGMLLPLRVWDLPTRLFHWAIVLVVVISYVSITLADGPQAGLWMKIHVISGETMLGLLLFRITWGLIGSETARFRSFLKSPLAALRHLRHIGRREPDRQVGHNEAGGWMVLGLLALLAAQVATGLGSNDDGSTEGPLVQFMSKATSDLLSKLHGLNFDILAATIGLHVAAVIVYGLFKGQNLTRAMITGKKRMPAMTRAPRMSSPLIAAITLAVVAGVTVAISRL